MSRQPKRPATWAELTETQQGFLLDQYRKHPEWAALPDEQLVAYAELLYDAVDHHRKMRAFIAATMTPEDRAALPTALEGIAQDPSAYGLDWMTRRHRQDLMHWVGELENDDPRETVSGYQEG